MMAELQYWPLDASKAAGEMAEGGGLLLINGRATWGVGDDLAALQGLQPCRLRGVPITVVRLRLERSACPRCPSRLFRIICSFLRILI